MAKNSALYVAKKCVLLVAKNSVLYITIYNFSKYKKIEYIYDDDDNMFLKYHNEKYYRLDYNIFRTDISKMKQISWHFNLPATLTIVFYSYDLNVPDYIFVDVGTEVYINEKYDYKSDIFFIENSDSRIKFSDAFEEEYSINYTFSKSSDVKIFNFHSDKHPELYSSVCVISDDGKYYMSFDARTAYKISDEFLTMLITNKVI